MGGEARRGCDTFSFLGCSTRSSESSMLSSPSWMFFPSSTLLSFEAAYRSSDMREARSFPLLDGIAEASLRDSCSLVHIAFLLIAISSLVVPILASGHLIVASEFGFSLPSITALLGGAINIHAAASRVDGS